VKASASDFAAAWIVFALALIALARSDSAERPHAAPVRAHQARPAPTATAVTRLRDGQVLELNRATPGDLVLLPGIGPKLAQRIVDERERRGGFASVDELRSVKGVGRATLARIRPWLSAAQPASPVETSQVVH